MQRLNFDFFESVTFEMIINNKTIDLGTITGNPGIDSNPLQISLSEDLTEDLLADPNYEIWITAVYAYDVSNPIATNLELTFFGEGEAKIE